MIIVGANGHLGPSILKALIDADFKVSVLTRATSKSTYPSNVNVLKTDDDLPHDQLVKALTGQEALVLAFAGTQTDNSIKIIDAAFEAGVKHVIPADFGSCDSGDPRSLDLIPLYGGKKVVRDHLIGLTQKTRPDGSTIAWTSLVNGHFFDYGLKSGLLSINLEQGWTRIFDDGNYKHALTKLADIGTATAKILRQNENPRLKNKLVYLHGLQTTQNDLLAAVEEVTGKKFEKMIVNSDDFIKENKAKLKKNPDDHETTEELVSVEGIVNTNFDGKGDAFVNDLVGLPKQSLKQQVEEALR